MSWEQEACWLSSVLRKQFILVLEIIGINWLKYEAELYEIAIFDPSLRNMTISRSA